VSADGDRPDSHETRPGVAVVAVALAVLVGDAAPLPVGRWTLGWCRETAWPWLATRNGAQHIQAHHSDTKQAVRPDRCCIGAKDQCANTFCNRRCLSGRRRRIFPDVTGPVLTTFKRIAQVKTYRAPCRQGRRGGLAGRADSRPQALRRSRRPRPQRGRWSAGSDTESVQGDAVIVRPVVGPATGPHPKSPAHQTVSPCDQPFRWPASMHNLSPL
jgi:hypothetical protein